MNLLFGKGYPKPETNSEFTPENGCFEDFFVSFGGPADFQGLLLLVSGRVCWLSTWWDIYLRGGYLPNKLPQAPIVDESPPEMRRSLHLGWHHKATLLLQKFNHQQDNSSKKNAKKKTCLVLVTNAPKMITIMCSDTFLPFHLKLSYHFSFCMAYLSTWMVGFYDKCREIY